MGWLLSLLPFLVVLFIVVSVVRTAMKVAQKASPPAKDRPAPANFDPVAAERTRQIQEEIRRKIAERRGVRSGTAVPARREPVRLPPSLPESTQAANTAALKRQEQLEQQMRALEAARLAERRKASELATVTREINQTTVSVAKARAELLADLRNPTTLRRVILLREVLGPPVGLR